MKYFKYHIHELWHKKVATKIYLQTSRRPSCLYLAKEKIIYSIRLRILMRTAYSAFTTVTYPKALPVMFTVAKPTK